MRLTIAEYLTPAMRHVTHVGAAQFESGRWIGGGIKPDIVCESKGIPSNSGGDLCVGLALDALSEADSRSSIFSKSDGWGPMKRTVRNVSAEVKKVRPSEHLPSINKDFKTTTLTPPAFVTSLQNDI